MYFEVIRSLLYPLNCRKILPLILILGGLTRPGEAQQVIVPELRGEVFADGRPYIRTIAIRLEAQDSSLVATAYTAGSSTFTFRDITLGLEQSYSLVIKDPAFKAFRYTLNMNDFTADSAAPRLYHFGGMIMLNLESVPPAKEILAVPPIVNAKQLKAKIPREAKQQYRLGVEASAEGNIQVALQHLEKAVELAPDYYEALNKLGSEYLRAKDYRKSEAILGKVRELNPSDPLPLTNLGILYLEEGELLAEAAANDDNALSRAAFRKASEAFAEVRLLSPLSPRGSFYLGHALYRLGEYEDAEAMLLRALELDEQMHEARLMLLNIYGRQKRYEPALEQINAYLKANPSSPEKQRLQELRIRFEKLTGSK